MRDIVYCSICGNYYLRTGKELTQINCLEVTAEEMSRCLAEREERYWGGFTHPDTCGCDEEEEVK